MCYPYLYTYTAHNQQTYPLLYITMSPLNRLNFSESVNLFLRCICFKAKVSEMLRLFLWGSTTFSTCIEEYVWMGWRICGAQHRHESVVVNTDMNGATVAEPEVVCLVCLNPLSPGDHTPNLSGIPLWLAPVLRNHNNGQSETLTKILVNRLMLSLTWLEIDWSVAEVSLWIHIPMGMVSGKRAWLFFSCAIHVPYCIRNPSMKFWIHPWAKGLHVLQFSCINTDMSECN